MNTKGKIRLGYLMLAICSIYFVATLINQQKLFNAGQRELKILRKSWKRKWRKIKGSGEILRLLEPTNTLKELPGKSLEW